MVFMVIVVGLCFALFYGCSLVLDEELYGDRRDPSRCPELALVRGAVDVQVSVGGYGNPDWCNYVGEDGEQIQSLLPD